MSPSWVEGAEGSGFDVDHLPYGVFTRGAEPPRVGVRVGGFVVDLAPLAATAYDARAGLFAEPTLNAFLAAGPSVWSATREWLQDVLADEAASAVVGPHLVPVSEVSLQLPFEVAD